MWWHCSRGYVGAGGGGGGNGTWLRLGPYGDRGEAFVIYKEKSVLDSACISMYLYELGKHVNTHMWTLNCLKITYIYMHLILWIDWAGLHCRVSYGLQRWAPDTGSAKGGEQDLGKYMHAKKK